MATHRIARVVGVGSSALAATALLIAVAPAATAAQGDDPERPAGPGVDAPYFGARLAATADGATVIFVDDDGPADDAGLSQGDIVKTIDGIDINRPSALREAISGASAGDELVVVYSHDGATLTATVLLADAAERPPLPAPEDVAWVGIGLERWESADGVVVRHVADGGPAAAAGISQGDVITEVNGHELDSWWEARDMLRDVAPGDTITVVVMRDGHVRDIEVTTASLADAPRPDGSPMGGFAPEGAGPDGSGPDADRPQDAHKDGSRVLDLRDRGGRS